jgi:hypothetical protein
MDRAAIREENTYEHLKILRAPDVLCVEADGDFEILAAPSAGYVGTAHCAEAVDEAQDMLRAVEMEERRCYG